MFDISHINVFVFAKTHSSSDVIICFFVNYSMDFQGLDILAALDTQR